MRSARTRTILNRAFGYRSIRFRLTAIFLALFGTTLIIFSSVLYSTVTIRQQQDFDAALYNHAVDISDDVHLDFFGTVVLSSEVLSKGGKIFPFATGGTFLEVLDMSGKVLAKSRALRDENLPLSNEVYATTLESGFQFDTIPAGKIHPGGTPTRSPYRMISYLVKKPNRQPFIVQVAVSMSLLEKSSRGLLLMILLGVPATLLAAAIGGLYVSRRALRPISEIIDKARSLDAAQLSERVPVPTVDDELRELSLTLNELLDRLQQAFESHERFIADASHELKTPLAIMRGELDLLRSKAVASPEIAEVLASTSQELDSLARIVEDLLLLARVEAGAGSLSQHEVRMDELAMEVVSRLEGVARQKEAKIRLDLDASGSATEFVAKGDPDLLKVMLRNLVENAIKFSPRGGVVSVRIEDFSGEVACTVRDQGPGIPEGERAKIFESFYRYSHPDLKASGAGLGLAITRRIVEAHGASIEITSDAEPGAIFRVRIKKF